MRPLALVLGTGVLVAALGGCDRAATHAWTWSGDGPSRSGLHRLEDGVLFGNEAGTLVRLNRDGSAAWTAQVGREVAARPTVVGGTAVAATVGGEWVGVELSTGREAWRVGNKPPLLLPLASDDRRVFAVAQDGSVLAISPASGGTAWKRVPPRGYTGTPPPSAAPVAHDGRLFVGLGPAGLFALEPGFGELLWHRAGVDVLGFLVEGERVYVLGRDGRLLALRAADGGVEWERSVERAVSGGPHLARGLLWVATSGVGLLAVDPQDGTETWHVALPAALRGGVGEYRELVLVPTSGRAGRLLGFRPGREAPVVDARADSALRSEPVLFGDLAIVQASDGRVLAWEIRRTTP
jgi:outer membrane protein assembly factor BamB